jgi:hypothetical protein
VYSQENFSSFWSTGSGWGNYQQKEQEIILEVDYGNLHLNRLDYSQKYPDFMPAVEVNGKSIKCNPGKGSSIVFKPSLQLNEGGLLRLVWNN